MKPTQGSAMILRLATSSSTESMKRTPSSQCKCLAIRPHTNFQPPRWCCHGARLLAFSFLVGVKGSVVSICEIRANSSTRAYLQTALIRFLNFSDAPDVFTELKIVLPMTSLIELYHQRSLRVDIFEKMGKFPACAVVD